MKTNFQEIVRGLKDRYLSVQKTPTVNEWRRRFEEMPLGSIQMTGSGGIKTLDITYQETDSRKRKPGKLIFDVYTEDVSIATESVHTLLKDAKPRPVERWDLKKVSFPDNNR